VKQYCSSLGRRRRGTPVGNSPQEFDAFMRAEAAKWEPVLKEANIKMR